MLWVCAVSIILVWLNHMWDGYRPWRLWRRLWQSEKRVDLRRVPVEAFWDSQSLNLDLGDSEHSFASWPSISRFLIPATCGEYGCILFALWPLNLHMHAQKGPSPHRRNKIISASARFSCYFFDPISIQDASKWLGHVHVHLHLVPPFQSATACIEDANLRRDKFLREKIAIDTQHWLDKDWRETNS